MTASGRKGDIYSSVCQQAAMGENVMVMALMPVAAMLLLISQQVFPEQNCLDLSH